MRRIKFFTPTQFLGRNGSFKCIGLEITKTPHGDIWIEPTTSKKETGRARIEIPAEALARVCAALNSINSGADTRDSIPESDEQITQYVLKGQIIKAIKMYRTMHGTTLVDSKAAIDEMRRVMEYAICGKCKDVVYRVYDKPWKRLPDKTTAPVGANYLPLTVCPKCTREGSEEGKRALGEFIAEGF